MVSAHLHPHQFPATTQNHDFPKSWLHCLRDLAYDIAWAYPQKLACLASLKFNVAVVDKTKK